MFRLFISDRIFVDDNFYNGGILVNNDGKIEEIFKDRLKVDDWLSLKKNVEVNDYKDFVIMPGLIDTHVHISEPGRSELEGFVTGTRAAAAGGFTTIVDMPLNSIPPTTTVENLLEKQKATAGKICVDVGFWGGIIPGNAKDLRALHKAGVVGFKCFLHPSGDETFPCVTEDDVELACQHLTGLDALVAFHAEKCNDKCTIEADEADDVYEYNTYLKTRPASLELNAIEMIIRVAEKYDNIRAHIVHLSAASALPLIKNFRNAHENRLTVETCHHYLVLNAEDIPRYRVDFKCCPPIRELENQVALWEAVKTGDINMIVSDHSPNVPEKKMLVEGSPDYGNFVKSWGGIPGVQFGLSLFWTDCGKYGLGISDMVRLMCQEPAKMCKFDHRKGKIAIGYDADFCVWDPTDDFTVTEEMIHFRNKANPYMGQRLRGLIYATIVRGQIAYKRTENDEKFNFVGNLLKNDAPNLTKMMPMKFYLKKVKE